MRLSFPSDGTFLLAAPLLVATVLLVLAPAAVAFVFAFTEYDALTAPRFTGLANLRKLWSDPLFWTAMKNSSYIVALSVPLRLARPHYQNGFEYLRFGYASAMTVAMFILTALMVGAQLVVLQLWRNRQRRLSVV